MWQDADFDAVDSVVDFDQNHSQFIALQSHFVWFEYIMGAIEGNGKFLERPIQQLQITEIEFMGAKDGDLNNPIVIIDHQVDAIFPKRVDFFTVG